MSTRTHQIRVLSAAELEAVGGGTINAMNPGVQACLQAFEKAGGTLSDPGLVMHPGPNCCPARGSLCSPG